jgi:hypothetical protein
MIWDAEDILWRELMWSDDRQRFDIDLASISDDLASVQQSKSFVIRQINQLEGKEGWMIDQMMRTKKSKRLWVDKQWQMTRVQKYSQQVKDFLEHLLALIYMTSGQLACGEEITLIWHRNGFL